MRNPFMETTLHLVLICDKNGVLEEVNPAWREVLGYEEDEVLGKSVLDFVHEDDYERTLAQLQTGACHKFENKYVHKDGSSRDIVWTAYTNEDGKIYAIGHDITERIKVETALKENENRLTTIMNTSMDGILMIDKDGIIIDLNAEVANRLNVAGDEIIGKCVFDLLPEDVAKERRGIVERIIKEGKPLLHQDQVGDKCIEASVAPVMDQNKNVKFLIVISRDITERIQTEEALKKSEEKYKGVFDESIAAIYVFDREKNFIDSNQAGLNLLGYSREELLTMSIPDVDADPQAVLPAHGELLSGRKIENYEHRLIRKDGTIITVLNNSRALTDGNNNVIGMLSTLIDITQLKENEVKERHYLEQENMAKIGRVAGKIAHDFNNILGITLGTSELLLAEDLPEYIESKLRAIKLSAERGREIAQNLLFFAKDREAKYEQLDLNEMIRTILVGLNSEMQNINLNVDYGTGLDKVTADASLLENAIINVINNAIHAVSRVEKSKIAIKTERKVDNLIAIEIRDNGCGIPQKYHKNVYDPSFTMKGGMDKFGLYRNGIKGSGYGLANAKRGIEKHGGTISFESEVDEGTTFRIEIPIIDVVLKPDHKEMIDKTSETTGKSILIVEDEIHFGNVLYSLLCNLGCKVNLVQSGGIALEHLAENEYDAISLDLILPDMSGMVIYEQIRKTNKDVPIIFVSGNFEFMQSMIALKETDPNVDHLAKPFNNVDYVKKINEWLSE